MGELVRFGEDGYENARVSRQFNSRTPDRFPAAVLFAETEQDVVEGVQLARRNGWQIAIRSGGHSWPAWSLRDDALLIDLGRLREMDLDPATGIVKASPAVTAAEFDAYLAAHDRFFSGVHLPTVALGGFLLQGGQGWNTRGWGWAAESIEAVDVVTAASELVHASEAENADLFWAARGAGPGFFGAVTRFHLRTRPRFRHAAQSMYLYPSELFNEVMTWQLEMHGTVSPDVELISIGMAAPPGMGYEGDVFAVTGLALVDTPEQAAAALAPLEACPVLSRALVRDVARPTSIAELLAQLDQGSPAGRRYVVDSAWIDAPPAQAVPALRNLFRDFPSPMAHTIWFSMAPLRELPDMAFDLQTENYVASYVLWDDESDDERCRDWLAQRMAELEPVTAGQYLGDSDFTTRHVKFTSDRNFARLAEIRRRWDPDGAFVSYLTSGDAPLNTNQWQA
jgi:FAD/FMN-containing dehydrogenase